MRVLNSLCENPNAKKQSLGTITEANRYMLIDHAQERFSFILPLDADTKSCYLTYQMSLN
jgi:hypothetical protein